MFGVVPELVLCWIETSVETSAHVELPETLVFNSPKTSRYNKQMEFLVNQSNSVIKREFTGICVTYPRYTFKSLAWNPAEPTSKTLTLMKPLLIRVVTGGDLDARVPKKFSEKALYYFCSIIPIKNTPFPAKQNQIAWQISIRLTGNFTVSVRNVNKLISKVFTGKERKFPRMAT